MSLDDHDLRSSADMVREAAEEDERRRRADWEEQRMLESIEAMETHWVGVMAQMPEHVRRTHYGSDVTS